MNFCSNFNIPSLLTALTLSRKNKLSKYHVYISDQHKCKEIRLDLNPSALSNARPKTEIANHENNLRKNSILIRFKLNIGQVIWTGVAVSKTTNQQPDRKHAVSRMRTSKRIAVIGKF